MVKKIMMVGINMFLTIIILFGVFIFISFLPIEKNYELFSVLSGSMEPAIKTGALVIVRPVDSYGEGDVVTRQIVEENITVTHRIIAREEKNGVIYFQTRGDANNVADEDQFTSDTIVGKVLWDVPYMGYIVNFARTKNGLLLFIIIPATAVIIEESWRIKKELQRMKNEKVIASKEESTQSSYHHDLMADDLLNHVAQRDARVFVHTKPRK